MDYSPERAGLNAERLSRITDFLQRNYIEPQKISGCQVVVARHGALAYEASLGLMDIERARPMLDDTIFRIYSMTKPITSIALMQLYEQGLFQLNDPVHRIIPSWKNLAVYDGGDVDNMSLKSPDSPMTVRHLLGHGGIVLRLVRSSGR